MTHKDRIEELEKKMEQIDIKLALALHMAFELTIVNSIEDYEERLDALQNLNTKAGDFLTENTNIKTENKGATDICDQVH